MGGGERGEGKGREEDGWREVRVEGRGGRRMGERVRGGGRRRGVNG